MTSDLKNAALVTGVGVRREVEKSPDKEPDKGARGLGNDRKLYKAEPTMEFQIDHADKCRSLGCETSVFDLADAGDLKKWNAMQVRASGPLATFKLIDLDRQFCTKTENWKLLVTVEHYEFEDILPDVKPPFNNDN